MSFDPIAPHYTWMECVLAGRTLQSARTGFVDEIRSARSILLVGEGHGRFLPVLASANTRAVLTCLDASEGMLRMAANRLPPDAAVRSRVKFCHSSIIEFNPDNDYDLVVTHFFLDCFERIELERVVSKITSLLQPGGTWIVADFQIPRCGWRKLRARLVLWLAYAFFRAAVRLPARGLVDPEPCLAANGLSRQKKVTFNHDLVYAALWKKGVTSGIDRDAGK